VRRQLHEPDGVDGATEQAVRVGDVERRGNLPVPRAALPDEDPELVADVLGPQVVDLGVSERRPVVARHALLLSPRRRAIPR
jgi:hypothetical protein